MRVIRTCWNAALMQRQLSTLVSVTATEVPSRPALLFPYMTPKGSLLATRGGSPTTDWRRRHVQNTSSRRHENTRDRFTNCTSRCFYKPDARCNPSACQLDGGVGPHSPEA